MKQFTRSLSLMLTVLMLLAILPVSLLTIKVSAADFYSGTGTSTNPYVISTKAHLNNIRYYPGKYFTLKNNIVFSSSDFAPGGDFYNGGAGWLPIGPTSSSDGYFRASINGYGYSIYGLKMNVTDPNVSYIGFFGKLEGIIHELNFKDVDITIANKKAGYVNCGILSGVAKNAKVRYCEFSGKVNAKVYDSTIFGSVAGILDDSELLYCKNYAKITIESLKDSVDYIQVGGLVGNIIEGVVNEYCSNHGDIFIEDFTYIQILSVGGIAGYLSFISEPVRYSYNTGKITHSTSKYPEVNIGHIGGIVGDSYSDISDCYNSGNIIGGAKKCYLGGVVGRVYKSSIENCYNVGLISQSSWDPQEKVGALAGAVYPDSKGKNNHYLDNMNVGIPKASATIPVTKRTDKEMRNKATFVGFDFSNIWFIDLGLGYKYPQLRNNRHPYVETVFDAGIGAAADPYLISTKAQLNSIRDYPGKYFALTNDIVFTSSDFAPGGDFYNGGAGWLPIVNEFNPDDPFVAHITGYGRKNRAIRGLKMNAKDSDTRYFGFFGSLKGTVYDISFLDVDIAIANKNRGMYSGILAGEIRDSSIQKCNFSGKVSVEMNKFVYFGSVSGLFNNSKLLDSVNYTDITLVEKDSILDSIDVGGLIGSSGDGSRINYCANHGDIVIEDFYSAAVLFLGGIAGFADKKCEPTKYSYNTGNITHSTTAYSDIRLVGAVGGVIGDSYADISDCYNSGDITISANKCRGGGVVGRLVNGSIENCYNVGLVRGSQDNIGAISGYVFPDSTGKYNYYLDNMAVGYSADSYGAIATQKKTDLQMRTQFTFLGFDFTADWFIDPDHSYKYPQLKKNPHPYLDTIFDAGVGSDADPYRISTKQQLNSIRDYPGKYFMIMNDIVFTPSDFAPGGDFYNDGAGWLPIVNKSNPDEPFVAHIAGYFGNKTIRGLKMNATDPNMNYLGFFSKFKGMVSNISFLDVDITIANKSSYIYGGIIAGTMRDATIENCKFSGKVNVEMSRYDNFGSVSALIYNTKLENCQNYADITMVKSQNKITGIIVAGIVASCYDGSDISYCANHGDILIGDFTYASTLDAGGIAGSVSKDCKPIKYSYNTGNITQSNPENSEINLGGIGGIVGDCSADISDCYNSGDIIAGAKDGHVGGIVGRLVKVSMENCYNVGSVAWRTWDSHDKVGAIAGYVFSDSTGKNNYYLDNNTVGFPVDSHVSIPTHKKTDQQMRTQSTFAGFNFTADWFIDPDHSYKYPQLKKNPHPYVELSLNKLVLKEDSTYRLGSHFSGYLTHVPEEASVDTVINNFMDTDNIFIFDTKGNLVTSGTALVGTGYTVKYIYNNEVKDEVPVIVLGDVSGDGKITAADYLLAKRAFLGSIKLSAPQLKAATLSGSDTVKSSDYLMIKRHFLKTYVIYWSSLS